MRIYELVFVAQPNLEDEGLAAVVEHVQELLIDGGGEILRVDHMGRRRLAYPIQKHDEGYYVLIHAEVDQTTMPDIERALNLSEDILRYLFIRLYRK